jgi:hypothetical protein
MFLLQAVPQQLKQWVDNNPSHPFSSGAMISSQSMQQVLKNEALLHYLMMVSPLCVAKYIYVASVDPFPRYRYVVATPLMHLLSLLLRVLPTFLADRLALNL